MSERIERCPAAALTVLSYGQELLWLLDRASGASTAWNVSRAFRLRGALDGAALQAALDALAARHDTLRSLFLATQDGPRQQVLPPASVPIRRVDLGGLNRAEREAEAARLVAAAADMPFDLSRDVALRVMLVKLAADEHILVIDSHHIVSDGWSKSILLTELSALYGGHRNGTPVSLPPLPIAFSDYAAWERSAEHQASLSAGLAYWRKALDGLPPQLQLPIDRPRPVAPTYDAARSTSILPPPLVDGVDKLARQHGATRYMALLTTFAIVLHRYGNQDDVVIGSPSAGRLHEETEQLIGFFANTLVLRVRFAGDPSFAELLERVRETCLDAYGFADVPLEKLVLELAKERELRTTPLFNVVMTMEDTLPAQLHFAGLEVTALESAATKTKFDLTLLIGEQPQGLRLTLLYRTDLFEPATADRVLAHLRTVLEAAVRNPEQPTRDLPLLTPAEEAQLAAWNDTAPEGATVFVPVHETIARQARRVPAATALVCAERRLTYRELRRASAALQRRLRGAGIGSGAMVGLFLERSIEAIVALLGILQTGAAYVPLM
ncbi:MAG: condensation domain-containing protein, partial [Candidatus Eremiobacteraeota bacterium]|nr:condensation domain-containing protein [Candidatus Eremiobacteraeota bacterium]